MDTANQRKHIQRVGYALTVLLASTVIYFFYPAQEAEKQSTEAAAQSKYSFENPGQLIEPATASTQRYADMTPEQLQQAAADIISQNDQILQDNPIQLPPMTEQEKAKLDQQISELDQKILQIEKQLKQ